MNTNYLTFPLTSYDPTLQDRAADLFHRVVARVGRRRARAEKGSYSFLSKTHGAVAAKIIIYERGAKPILSGDGVYILTSVRSQGESGETMAVGPWWNSRYRYARLSSDENLDETADFIQDLCDNHDIRANGDRAGDAIQDDCVFREDSRCGEPAAQDPATVHQPVTRDDGGQDVGVECSRPQPR